MLNGAPDDIDLQILQLLQANARLDVMELVRQVNLSKTPVAKRLKKLKDTGVIKQFVAVLDRQKIGQPVLVVVQVKLREQTLALLSAFEQTALAMPEVQACLHVSGGWDFFLHMTAVTPQAYYVFLMERICGLPNVAHVESCFVMKECKSFGPFSLNGYAGSSEQPYSPYSK